MSMYDDIIDANPLKYFHQEDIPEDDESGDPLTRVVPCLDGEFFGPFVCNFLIFTKLSNSFEDVGTRAKLAETYSKFARYELHIYMDSEALSSASEDELADMDELCSGLASELAAYGVTYHGQLGGEQLKASIEEVIHAFNQAVT